MLVITPNRHRRIYVSRCESDGLKPFVIYVIAPLNSKSLFIDGRITAWRGAKEPWFEYSRNHFNAGASSPPPSSVTLLSLVLVMSSVEFLLFDLIFDRITDNHGSHGIIQVAWR